MPAKSGKQYRMMQAAAHGTSKMVGGPSPEVAKEMIEKTPAHKRRMFAKMKKKHGNS